MKIKEYGYEYDATLNEQLWQETKGKVTYEKFKGAHALRSGRDTLKAIAREYSPTVALLPALSCDSMVLPFEMYGHEVRFYQLNKDYSISIENLEKQIEKDTTVLLLYMDYFEKTALSDNALTELRQRHKNLVFIEDRTHNLLNQRTSDFEPEYIIASLRKWSNIPDGGLLWNNVPMANGAFSEDTNFSEIRLRAQCNRHEFLKTGDERIKTEYRKVFSTVSDIIDNDKLPGRMSEYSFRLAQQTDYDTIKEKRINNAQALVSRLQQAGFSFVQEEVGTGDLYIPVLVENRDALQRKLSAEGIFCTVIWPLSDVQRESCQVAKYTEEHLLAVYCDQRMSKEDMEYIASRIVELNNE